MIITDGINIKVPRGDTAAVSFTFCTENEGVESPYIFAGGQYMQLAVYPVRGAEAVLTKTVSGAGQQPDGTVTVALSAEDTDIGRGKYIYTVRLLTESGNSADTWLGAEHTAEFEII
mgnify:CR=1 FL=1